MCPQIADPLEGTPLVLAEGATTSFAERINERLERTGGASFAQLLQLLTASSGGATAVAKRACRSPPASAPGLRRRISCTNTEGGPDGGVDDDDAEGTDDMLFPSAKIRRASDGDAAMDEDDLESEDNCLYMGDCEEPTEDQDDDDDDDDDLAEEVATLAPCAASASAGSGSAAGSAAQAFHRLQESTQGRAVSLSKRMQGDLLEMMRGDSAARGFHVELANPDRLDVWRVQYTTFPDGSQLALDLATLGSATTPQAEHAAAAPVPRRRRAECPASAEVRGERSRVHLLLKFAVTFAAVLG